MLNGCITFQFHLVFMMATRTLSLCQLAVRVCSKPSLSPLLQRVAYSKQLATYDKDNEFLLVTPGMRAKVIDGKKIAARVQMEVKDEVKAMEQSGKRAPFLAAVLVGDNPASKAYISNKTKAAKKCGIETTTILRDDSVSQDELLELVDSLNRDDKVSVTAWNVSLCCFWKPAMHGQGFHLGWLPGAHFTIP